MVSAAAVAAHIVIRVILATVSLTSATQPRWTAEYRPFVDGAKPATTSRRPRTVVYSRSCLLSPVDRVRLPARRSWIRVARIATVHSSFRFRYTQARQRRWFKALGRLTACLFRRREKQAA